MTKARASFDAAISSTELATLETDVFSSGQLKQHLTLTLTLALPTDH